MMYDMKKVMVFIFTLLLLIGGGAYYYLFYDATPNEATHIEEIKEETPEPAVEDKPVEDMSMADLTPVRKLIEEQKYEEAKTLIDELLPKHPQDAELRILAANFYHEHQKDLEKAISLLEEGIEIQPDNLKVLTDLALLYSENGTYTMAYQHIQKAHQLAKGDGIVPILIMDTYIWITALTGNPELALQMYVDYIFTNDEYPFDDPSSMLHFALILESMNQTDQAKGVYNDILSIKEANLPEEVVGTLGWAQGNAQNRLGELK